MSQPPRSLARTLALFGIAFAASVGFVVIAALVLTGAIDRLDTQGELAVHRLDSPTWDAVAKTATFIGSDAILLPVAAIVVVLALLRRRLDAALVLAIDTGVVIGLNRLLKVMFARDRPTLFDKIALPTSYSFPSGHAMEAVGIYGVVAAVLIVLFPRARGVLIAAAVLLAVAIGLSRIYLGVHWPFDVLGGALGGVPPLVASVHLLHRGARPSRSASSRGPGSSDS